MSMSVSLYFIEKIINICKLLNANVDIFILKSNAAADRKVLYQSISVYK